MKILYVAKQILNNAAPKVHVLSVCEEFVRQGHKVVLLTYYPTDDFGGTNFRIIKVPKCVFRRSVKKNSLVWKVYVDLIVLFFDPDIIYERYTSNHIVNPTWRDSKRVVEINGWPPDYRGERWNKLYKLKWERDFKKSFSQVPLIIASSNGFAKKTRNLLDNANSNVFFIPNGVNVPCRHNQKKRLVSKDKIRVGYIGGFTVLQDIDTLVHSISILHRRGREITLHLIGDGDLRAKSERLCNELGIRDTVKFYGWVANSDLHKVSGNFDVAVAPYQRVCIERANGMDAAMKLFVYWAYRKPVIISDLTTSRTYKEHHLKRYYAVPPESPESLAEAILYLVENPNSMSKMVENGYRYVIKNHSWKAIVRRIITTINNEFL